MLVNILKENNVNSRGMRFDPGARTALAFVTLRNDGEREFMFYRNPSADMLLQESELDFDIITKVWLCFVHCLWWLSFCNWFSLSLSLSLFSGKDFPLWINKPDNRAMQISPLGSSKSRQASRSAPLLWPQPETPSLAICRECERGDSECVGYRWHH